MKTSHRDYVDRSVDFNRLCDFVVTHNAFLRSHSTWCLGRLVDWRYGLWGDKLSTPGFWERNAQLWFDGFGELAGLVISEEGRADVAILTAEGYRFLFEEILAWILDAWGEREGGLSMEITARQTLEARMLERQGFQRESSFYTFRYDLTTDLAERCALEEDFAIVDMHAHPDYRAQHILRQDAFAGRSDLTDEEVERELKLYNYAHESPIYHPQTDLCVMAPDGALVAGCEALIDAHNAEADIERVCTHSGYRRHGLARAVIQECLYRLRDMGLRRAYITGYSPAAIGLYASLGPTDRKESLIYKRP